ncbi:MAG: ABC transporter ATP-binding protein [Anaeroplasmataceae bacterium]
MIQLINIEKKFQAENEFIALKDVSIDIEDKKLTTIIGKSGSGKSTLLNIIGGLLKPTNGEVIVNGRNINQLNDIQLATFRNEEIGYIFQSFFLDKDMTALENVMVPLMIKGVNKKERVSIARKMLESVGLESKENIKVSKLSGGEKQRVAIARAIVNNPKIILADEPTGNLDSENGKIVMSLLKTLSREKTVVLVTHNLEDAMTYSDTIIKLKDGMVIYED